MRHRPSTGMLAGSSPSGKWARAARTQRQVLVLRSEKWERAARTRRLVLVLPSGKWARAARTRRLVLVLPSGPSGTRAARTQRLVRRWRCTYSKCGLVKMNKRYRLALTQFHSERVSFQQHTVLPDLTTIQTPIWIPHDRCNLSCSLPQARARWRSREERRSPLVPRA